MAIIIKICSKCKEVKSVTQFYKHPDTRSGYEPLCKFCRKRYRRLNYLKNRDQVLKQSKEYYHVNKEKQRESKKRYYLANKERIVKRHQNNWKKWYEANKEIRSQYMKEWFQTPNGRAITNHCSRRRAARKSGAEGSHTVKEWMDLKANYKHACPMCKRREPGIKLTEDHVIPLLAGGTDYIDNIQPLCKSCNSKKHTKIVKVDKIGQLALIL